MTKSVYSAPTNTMIKASRYRVVASDFEYTLVTVVPAPLAAAADTAPSSEVDGEAVGAGGLGGSPLTSPVPHTLPPDWLAWLQWVAGSPIAAVRW